MKTKMFMLATLFLTGILLSSCTKNDDDGGTPSTGNGSVSLKVDGQSWSATLATVAVKGDQGLVSLTGSDSDAHQVSFTLLNAQATGTYTIGGLTNQNQARWTAGLSTTDTYLASMVLGSGEVVITEYSDAGFKGTFQFEAYNTSQQKVSVTNGAFEANF